MHTALADPKINAPQWPWLRLFAVAGIAWAVLSVLNRVGRTFTEDGLEVAMYTAGLGLMVVFAVVVIATGLSVRRLRALEARVPPASADRLLFPTFGFGTTGVRLLAASEGDASPRGLWGWKLVEVTADGVRVHAHPDYAELTRTFPAADIVDAAPGAITDGMFRIPTLNLAITTPSGAVGVPLGLMQHPLAVMRVEEREATLVRVRQLLGLPRGS